jgi:methylamine dehydrogenase heavy chain
MKIASKGRSLITAVAGIVLAGSALAQAAEPPPLPIEPTGIIETLPAVYPPSWFLVHDIAFFHMSDGKVYVIDSAAPTLAEQVKGTFNVSMIGNTLQAAKRGEIYAVETFQSRGTRGKRTDVLTIWDQQTLSPRGEVILPGNKRFQGMPERYAMLLIDDGRWLGVANFSPATSTTLIDLDSRKIIGEIATPGCVLTYPMGKRGFSSLCADGRLLSTELAADGSVVKQTRSEPFFNSDSSPIFERPTLVGNTLYFPSIAGLMHPVDVSGPEARIGEAWNLVPEAERAKKWAPAGLGLIDHDDQGRIYIIMHPDAVNGSYQGGGPEVWVYDPVAKKRVQRIALKSWGISLALSRGENPVLMVVNPADMSLEMYNAGSGEYIRTITGFGQETPLLVRGAQ